MLVYLAEIVIIKKTLEAFSVDWGLLFFVALVIAFVKLWAMLVREKMEW